VLILQATRGSKRVPQRSPAGAPYLYLMAGNGSSHRGKAGRWTGWPAGTSALDGTGAGLDHPDPADTDGHDHTAATAVWSPTGPYRPGSDTSPMGPTCPDPPDRTLRPRIRTQCPTPPDPRLENAIEELDRYLPCCNNPVSFTHLCTENEGEGLDRTESKFLMQAQR